MAGVRREERGLGEGADEVNGDKDK